MCLRIKNKPQAVMVALLLGVMSFCPALLHAQSPSSEVLRPLDVARLQTVNEIAISEDGEQVAYTMAIPANPLKENRPPNYHLYVWERGSKSVRPYVTSMNVRNIAFRPGQKAISFLGQHADDAGYKLYQISLKGGEPRQLLAHETSIAGYNWATDGNHLAFMANEAMADTANTLPYQPRVFEENQPQRRGYITNLSKAGHTPHQVAVKGSIYQIKWSPDGESLALAVAPSPRIDDYYMNQQVLITSHHGDSLKARLNRSGKLGDIRWSPDGSYLGMLSAADAQDPIAGRLLVVPDSGGTPTQLLPDFEGQITHFRWSGAQQIHYLASKGTGAVFAQINRGGSGAQTLVNADSVALTQFSQAQDGSVAFTGNTAAHPNELFLLNSGEQAPRRITRSNAWLSQKKRGRQRAIQWTAADSTTLQGILLYPAGYDSTRQYPMITVVHGGPESHYDNGWVTDYSDPGQVAAGQGYFVFYPNYRGSTGRGEAFAKSSQGDMAGAEFDDIVAGVDALVSTGLVDSTRVGVTGGSYGGYATGWLSTKYTDRFAAGVMFVGISNAISKWGTSDIPQELYQVHTREHVWDDYQKFLERSPIYYAGQAQTPLLIMAGENDTRVDPGQSMELYRHIKTRTQTPVRLVLYPGEGHGHRNATAQYDYNRRLMQWFNEYMPPNVAARPDRELVPATTRPDSLQPSSTDTTSVQTQ